METKLPLPLSWGPGDVPPVGGPRRWALGEALLPAPPPSHQGAAQEPAHLRAPLPPVQGWKEQREQRTHPSSGVGLRRPPESAARPPGHMAPSRAEDQRGFVAAEQGASQSAGRGRRACDCLRREAPGDALALRGRVRGAEEEGQVGKGPPAAQGVVTVLRSAKEPSYPASLSHPRRKVTGFLGKLREGERGRLTCTSRQAAPARSRCACSHRPLLHCVPLPPA